MVGVREREKIKRDRKDESICKKHCVLKIGRIDENI